MPGSIGARKRLCSLCTPVEKIGIRECQPGFTGFIARMVTMPCSIALGGA